MATTSTGPRTVSRPRAENDIYTALMVVGFFFSLAGLIFIAFRAYSLFGTLVPPPGG